MILGLFQGNGSKVVIKTICSLLYFPLLRNLRGISACLLPVNSQMISMMVMNVCNERDFADIRWEILALFYTGVYSLFKNFSQMLNL